MKYILKTWAYYDNFANFKKLYNALEDEQIKNIMIELRKEVLEKLLL